MAKYPPVHLYRQMPTAPYERFAVTVQRDDNAASGYKVLDHDPDVADAVFLNRLEQHMHQPITVRDGYEDTDGHYETLKTLHPGDEGFFGAAVYQAPDAMVSFFGRVQR